MKKRSLLTLLEGNFEQGFPAILQMSSDQSEVDIETQVLGKLPPAPELWLTWQNWQLAYRQITQPQSRIKAKPAQITNISCRQLGSELRYLLNIWLNQGTPEWQKIRDCLQRNLHPNDEIEIVIQTRDTKLQRLPWHLWDFFDHYPHAEIAFSTCEYQKVQQFNPSKTKNQVKILAIFGDGEGLNLDEDRAYLEQLSSQAQIKFLVEPQLEELNDQLWETGWDILFFAGHSSSHEEGKIWLNKTDILTLEQLKYALKKSINNGLQLAIFNSCDGLILARGLSDLKLGQIVVMREPVPDVVAQIFLKYFLSAFAEGESLYASVRIARERLQKLETKYPYATWLPVIFQNPAAIAPTWKNLTSLPKNHRYLLLKKLISLISLPASVLGMAFLLGMRELELWHLIKLKALEIENNKTDIDSDDIPQTLVNSAKNIDANDINETIINPFSISGNRGETKLYPDQTSHLAVHQIADVNGDNINEIVIDISNTNDGKRKTYIVFGQENGFESELNLDSLDGNNGFVVNGMDINNNSNLLWRQIADVNGDSINEIVIDVLSSVSNGKRKTYIVFGQENNFDSELNLDNLDGNNGFVLSAIDWDNTSNLMINRIPDVSGDGISEILIDVSKTNDGNRKIYIVFGEDNSPDSESNLDSPNKNNNFIDPSNFSLDSVVSHIEKIIHPMFQRIQLPISIRKKLTHLQILIKLKPRILP